MPAGPAGPAGATTTARTSAFVAGDTLVVTGTVTQICVEETARQAFHHGYPTTMVSDAVSSFAPDLLQTTEHHLCSGCGHPVAWRILVEVLDELALVDRSIGVVGHGCYTQIITTADEMLAELINIKR